MDKDALDLDLLGGARTTRRAAAAARPDTALSRIDAARVKTLFVKAGRVQQCTCADGGRLAATCGRS